MTTITVAMVDAPMMRPSASRIGDTATDTSQWVRAYVIDAQIELALATADLAEAAGSGRVSLTAEQKHDVSSAEEMEWLADQLPIEQVARRWIVSSDPVEAVEKVADYLKYGLNHLVFHAPGHDQRRFLELFERDLAPRLRALG